MGGKCDFKLGISRGLWTGDGMDWIWLDELNGRLEKSERRDGE